MPLSPLTASIRNERDGAAARRFTFTYEELNVANVTRANTITLLRERARDLRATYVRLERCINDTPVVPFTFDPEEGDGSWSSRAHKLNEYIHKHVSDIEALRGRMNRDMDAKFRGKELIVVVAALFERCENFLVQFIPSYCVGTTMEHL